MKKPKYKQSIGFMFSMLFLFFSCKNEENESISPVEQSRDERETISQNRASGKEEQKKSFNLNERNLEERSKMRSADLIVSKEHEASGKGFFHKMVQTVSNALHVPNSQKHNNSTPAINDYINQINSFKNAPPILKNCNEREYIKLITHPDVIDRYSQPNTVRRALMVRHNRQPRAQHADEVFFAFLRRNDSAMLRFKDTHTILNKLHAALFDANYHIFHALYVKRMLITKIFLAILGLNSMHHGPHVHVGQHPAQTYLHGAQAHPYQYAGYPRQFQHSEIHPVAQHVSLRVYNSLVKDLITQSKQYLHMLTCAANANKHRLLLHSRMHPHHHAMKNQEYGIGLGEHKKMHQHYSLPQDFGNNILLMCHTGNNLPVVHDRGMQSSPIKVLSPIFHAIDRKSIEINHKLNDAQLGFDNVMKQRNKIGKKINQEKDLMTKLQNFGVRFPNKVKALFENVKMDINNLINHPNGSQDPYLMMRISHLKNEANKKVQDKITKREQAWSEKTQEPIQRTRIRSEFQRIIREKVNPVISQYNNEINSIIQANGMRMPLGQAPSPYGASLPPHIQTTLPAFESDDIYRDSNSMTDYGTSQFDSSPVEIDEYHDPTMSYRAMPPHIMTPQTMPPAMQVNPPYIGSQMHYAQQYQHDPTNPNPYQTQGIEDTHYGDDYTGNEPDYDESGGTSENY